MMESRLSPAFGKLLTVALAAVLALGMIGFLPTAANAAPVESIHIDPYLSTGTYKGVAVNFKVLDENVQGAVVTKAVVTVHRTVGGDVVKESKSSGSVPSALTNGDVVTAPIVIQQGTYDEAGSSSWVPSNAVWAAETLPEEVTVDIYTADGLQLTRTVDAPTWGPGDATIADVMPSLPSIADSTAVFTEAEYARYTGITVQVESSGITDAEQIIVQVDRTSGGPVVKVSQPNAGFFADLNSGAPRTTVPIVIQPGTYDEDGSSSWIKSGAVWTSNTVPTSVTITVKRAFGPDLVQTIALPAEVPSGIMPAADATPEVTVPTNQPADQPFVVDVPEGSENMNLNLGAATAGVITVQANVVVNTPSGASVNIPAGTTVTGPSDWNGVISVPAVVENVTVPSINGEKPTVDFAIKVGSADGQINFDKAVKIVLPGQAGKSAGFIGHDDVFHAIADKCGASPEGLTTGECWANDGDDLVIWTTHFTTYLSYSVTSTGGGADGDSLANTGSANPAPALANTGSANLAPALGGVGLIALIGLGLIALGRVRRQGVRR